ncbi:MAG: immune inhibitor A [Coriobacteriia bacterium]|nr:immune inhibitor A [Coriobacteriia bacterium]
MPRKLLSFSAVVVVFALLIAGAGVATAGTSNQKVAGSTIAVDADAYYKMLTGDDAEAKIAGDAAEAGGETALAGAGPADVGDVRTLYGDGFREFTLRAFGEYAEIWVANDLSYPEGDPRPTPVVTDEQVDYLLDEYNENIYPKMSQYFGYTNDRDGTGGVFGEPEWADRVDYDAYATDNPQRMMILVFNIIDEAFEDPDFPWYVAGYFWPEMNDVYVNRNIIHIDSHDWANRVGPDVRRPHLYEQVFTHEFEHAIHYDHDPDEPSWVDEGLADLAPYIVGYGHGEGHISEYLLHHRLPLTVWGGELADYGKSYLFQLYLMENFGGHDFVKRLVNDPANGIEGIENQVATGGYGASFDEIYRDWTIANYLDDSDRAGLSGARLGYESLTIPSADTEGMSIQWSVKNWYGASHKGAVPIDRYWGGYKSGTVEWPVGQLMPYAPLYQTYGGMSPLLVSDFRGAASSGVAAYSGSYQLWGGRGDLITTTATTAMPLSLGPDATLTFQTYFEIEEAWDFGFVQVTSDGGTTWTSLENDHTTYAVDPSAIGGVLENLPGFSGASDGWQTETFDLSAYAGQEVLIRFLYITDWAYNETGFYVDDVAVSDAGGTILLDDLEAGPDNWHLDGWLHTTGLAENDWTLTFINPRFALGKYAGYDLSDSMPFADGIYQRDYTTLDTSRLNRGEVTVILSNRLPEQTSFPADWRLFVSKGSTKK